MAEVKSGEVSDRTKTLFEKGAAAVKRGNMDYAMDLFESVLAIEPAWQEPRRRLKECAVQQFEARPPGHRLKLRSAVRVMQIAARLRKDPLKALADSEKLLRSDPFDLKFALLQYEAARAADLPGIAILALETLRRNRPAQREVLKPLAELYRQQEQFDLEFACREELAALEPGNGEYAKALKDAAARLTMGKAGWKKAVSYRDMVRQDDAASDERLLKQAALAVEEEPENPERLRVLADLQIKNRLHDQGIRTLEKILTLIDHEDPILEQKLMKAREHRISRLLAQAEDNGNANEAQTLRSELQELRINYAAAQSERYPNDLQLKFEFGKLLMEHERYTEAIQQFQEACRNPQRRVRSLLYMAQAFKAKGQLQIAKEKLETALKELPEMDALRKEVLYENGILSAQTGDTKHALSCFLEIYAVDITYRDVARRVEDQSA